MTFTMDRLDKVKVLEIEREALNSQLHWVTRDSAREPEGSQKQKQLIASKLALSQQIVAIGQQIASLRDPQAASDHLRDMGRLDKVKVLEIESVQPQELEPLNDLFEDLMVLVMKREALLSELRDVTRQIIREPADSENHKVLTVKQLAMHQEIKSIGHEIHSLSNHQNADNNDQLRDEEMRNFYRVKKWSVLIWLLYLAHPRFFIWRHHYLSNLSPARVDRFVYMYPSADDRYMQQRLSMSHLIASKPSLPQILFGLKFRRRLRSTIFMSFVVGVALCPHSVYRRATRIAHTSFPLQRKTDSRIIAVEKCGNVQLLVEGE